MFSFGDVLLAIGFAELITVLMTGDRHRWSAAGVPRTVRP
ncbi:hypothetical protein BX265_8395 [Streptomyces sp. TLI_235]|nr:hypothetical protein BX265_8395 [Streptomyces sp. TLI_235]